MSLKVLNPKAVVLNKSNALHMNINATKGLHDVLKTNLGPKGTIKMLVGGAGDIKLTKDGNRLLKEMVPASINSRLLEHQREGVKFSYNVYRNHHGGVLGDDMGLGKTIQTIASLAAIYGKDV